VPSAKQAIFLPNSVGNYDSERLAGGVNTSYRRCTSLAWRLQDDWGVVGWLTINLEQALFGLKWQGKQGWVTEITDR